MHQPFKNRYIIIVQILTISRAIAAIAFISTALIPEYLNFATSIFIYACLTDILDGFLARKFSCSSKMGGTMDLFSDKYLTIISLIYAIARDFPILPCSIAILREIFLLSIRAIHIEGKSLFPPQRILGTIMVIPIWLGVILLLQYPQLIKLPRVFFEYYYWTIGILAFGNLSYKLITNWKPLIKSFKE